jgi:alpha-glucuronidase
MRPHLLFYLLLFSGFGSQSVRGETGYQGWLRYAALPKAYAQNYSGLPNSVAVVGDSPVLTSAREELLRGLKGMLGVTPSVRHGEPTEAAIVLTTIGSEGLNSARRGSHQKDAVSEDAFWIIAQTRVNNYPCLVIKSATDRGVLYGVFALLSAIGRHEPLSSLNRAQEPSAPIRWIDQWDNLDGTIERGYAGRSIFFDNNAVRGDLSRVRDYARLLASVGINGLAINNVNANPLALTAEFLPQIARIADVLHPWGIRMSLSVDLSSPQKIGGLDTFDPLDPRVAEWWRAKVDAIYTAIPDFAGFVVKADSEGRLGPSTYNRTPADAANAVARALAPHGGIVFYRAFVYNHHLDWRDLHNDRARAAYDIFHPLDGKFDDNVIIQIKHGPIDFQAREPVSPLFAGLHATNEAIELQIMQEYTGQQHHLCFLPSMWSWVLGFDLHASDSENAAGTDSEKRPLHKAAATTADAEAFSPVSKIISGKAFHRPLGGYVGIANVGLDVNWLAHHLAMANLYGFARLAWSPSLDPRAIAEEWTRLTFGNDPDVVRTITAMQANSWRVYESYTGPLGAQTLTDITGSHYGPNIESSEENGWGQWHRADHEGIGMDRSVETGTGYAGQYPSSVAKLYESADSTPDNLLLFFHHVPYTYKLKSGQTVIQYIYASHYSGAKKAADFVQQWKSLQGKIDDERYADVLARLEYQAGHAIVWRDAICNYFLRLSGTPDAQGRAGHFRNRIEAESMKLDGYTPIDITPWENASGGKGIACMRAQPCSAEFTFDRSPGRYELDVEYFDQNNGISQFHVFLNDREIDHWPADAVLPAKKPGGDSSTRHRIVDLKLRAGDTIRIAGTPQNEEPAALDYVELISLP